MKLGRIHHKVFDNEYKCGGCNWAGTQFYSLEGPVLLDDADGPDDVRPTGLCAYCFMDMLIDCQGPDAVLCLESEDTCKT
jgi:hypothetical protein